jgi:carbamoyl-phosphate synthase large subunit
MEIVHDVTSLRRYMATAVREFGDSPVLIDSYLQDAIEVDVDALADGHTVYVAGIMEHIEEAGIHSGDSACALPPYSLPASIIAEIAAQTHKLAKGLGVVGLMNVQFAVKDGTVYVLEVNPRASRTVPFVAKARAVPLAKIAAQVMAGKSLASFALPPEAGTAHAAPHVAVKEAVFPFTRFAGVDTILGPEMKSTGEVMGRDRDFARAYAKAQLAAGNALPLEGTVFVSVKDHDKPAIGPIAAKLLRLGFKVVATRNTAAFLEKQGIKVDIVNKVAEGRPDIVDAIKNGDIRLIVNTTAGAQAVKDSFSIRRTAIMQGINTVTTMAGARATVDAIEALQQGALGVEPLQRRRGALRRTSL